MKIYAIHLLNDYSGSPKVLMQLAQGWIKSGIEVHLVTGSKRDGFLSDIPGVIPHFYWYKWSKKPLLRLGNLMLSQVLLFFILLIKVKRRDIIYINTVLPFGAAFLGKLKGCRVIYHIHETSVRPLIFKKILFGIINWFASEVIYVSKFLSEQEPISKKVHILYNAIGLDFINVAKKNRRERRNPNKVLMVCSLKDYKGVNEFVTLAGDNRDYKFRLVLNASNHEINTFFNESQSFSNLEIFNTQANIHPFYQWADVILNLSRPDIWIETFGLTIIEGMAYCLPAIVPPIGGVTELVEENVNGFLVDSRNRSLLNMRLNQLLNNQDLYGIMVKNATEKINNFSEKVFISNSLAILNHKSIMC